MSDSNPVIICDPTTKMQTETNQIDMPPRPTSPKTSTLKQSKRKKPESPTSYPSPNEKKYKTRAVFVVKLFELLQSDTHKTIISWYNNDSFVIWDCVRFAEHVLPLLYRHNNYASFVRQLNFYAFTKMKTAEGEESSSSLLKKNEPIKWHHPKFVKDVPIDQIYQIRRTTSPNFQMEHGGRGTPHIASIEKELHAWKQKIKVLKNKLNRIIRRQVRVLPPAVVLPEGTPEPSSSFPEEKSETDNLPPEDTNLFFEQCDNCVCSQLHCETCTKCIDVEIIIIIEKISELRKKLRGS